MVEKISQFPILRENSMNDEPDKTDFLKPKQEHVDQQWMLRHKLPIWTVYFPTTTDYPGKWVARMFLSLPTAQSTNHVILGDSLDEIHRQLPPGLWRIECSENDDPVIHESWI